LYNDIQIGKTTLPQKKTPASSKDEADVRGTTFVERRLKTGIRRSS
jgi:hypothetical protein